MKTGSLPKCGTMKCIQETSAIVGLYKSEKWLLAPVEIGCTQLRSVSSFSHSNHEKAFNNSYHNIFFKKIYCATNIT